MPQGFGFEKKRARIQLPADGWLIWGRDRPHCQVGMTATCRRLGQWPLFDSLCPFDLRRPCLAALAQADLQQDSRARAGP